MKKSLIGLLCVSACCLAGCGKGLTVEEACKFADEHWVKGEEATKKDVDCRTVIKIKKATGIFEDSKDENSDKTEKKTVKASSSVALTTLAGTGYKFSTFFGKLYADADLDLKEIFEVLKLVPTEYIKGSATSTLVFNKDGFVVSDVTKYSVSVDYDKSGASLKGSLSAVSKITYSL